jgi:hypothetical protein
VQASQTVSFSVPVRSEDAGEDLDAVFFLDQGPGSAGVFQNSQSLPAATYNDRGRAVTFDWTVPTMPLTTGSGMPITCHLLTLTVAHHHSFDPKHNAVLLKDAKGETTGAAKADAAIINWWLNADPTTPSTLLSCPTQGVVAQ